VERQRYRRHSRTFKLAALARMDTAPDVKALARELGVRRELLYGWQRHYIRGGATALRDSGRPRLFLMQPCAPSAAAEAAPAAVCGRAASAEERLSSPAATRPASFSPDLPLPAAEERLSSPAAAASASPSPAATPPASPSPALTPSASARPEMVLPLAAHDPVAAARRIVELERKVGLQQLDLDFFRAALRHVRELRR